MNCYVLEKVQQILPHFKLIFFVPFSGLNYPQSNNRGKHDFYACQGLNFNIRSAFYAEFNIKTDISSVFNFHNIPYVHYFDHLKCIKDEKSLGNLLNNYRF